MEYPAPAKINRYLRIIGKRADGYHQLDTAFQFLEFADTMRFQITPHARIRRIDAHDFALPEEDLCVSAARLLQSQIPAAARRGVIITLHKVIPPGSGLGGGSSNAATTLLALNHLWQLDLNRVQLATLALRLGADVPLFVFGQAARATSIGEILTPYNPAEQWLCICLSQVNVSTARVFAHADVERKRDGTAMSAVDCDADDLSDANDADNADKTGNDLEAITALIYPQVAAALTHMRRYCDAQMSGSGAAIYASFLTHAQAKQAATHSPPNLPTFITHSRNHHPLADFPTG